VDLVVYSAAVVVILRLRMLQPIPDLVATEAATTAPHLNYK